MIFNATCQLLLLSAFFAVGDSMAAPGWAAPEAEKTSETAPANRGEAQASATGDEDLQMGGSESVALLAAMARRESEISLQLEEARTAIAKIGESLAIANGEAEFFRQQYEALRLRNEAIGLDSLSKDRAQLEERLLNAVSDLRLEKERTAALEDQIISLSEAVFGFMAVSTGADPEVRLALEEQLRLGAALVKQFELPGAISEASNLQDARVLSVRSEWSFVVGNVGKKNGVRIGMPFDIVREGRKMGSVLAVDVRDKIFGGILSLSGASVDSVTVGDRMRVAVR